MGNRMYVPREIENNDYEFIHSFRWREGEGGGGVVGELWQLMWAVVNILCSTC